MFRFARAHVRTVANSEHIFTHKHARPFRRQNSSPPECMYPSRATHSNALSGRYIWHSRLYTGIQYAHAADAPRCDHINRASARTLARACVCNKLVATAAVVAVLVRSESSTTVVSICLSMYVDFHADSMLDVIFGLCCASDATQLYYDGCLSATTDTARVRISDCKGGPAARSPPVDGEVS